MLMNSDYLRKQTTGTRAMWSRVVACARLLAACATGRIALFGFVSLLLVGCGNNEGGVAGGGRPHVAYVTNGVASFWVIGEAGARAAGKEMDVKVDVRMPHDASVATQQRQCEELLSRGVDGIALSPIDATNQTAFIDRLCDRTNVVTQDSDAPKTDRLCYIGMDNYKAGRMAGQLVKSALPNGGRVMIFVGRLSQDNARHRRQGVIDELLNRSMDRTRYDAPSETLVGASYTILDTRTDGFDRAKAKANAQDAITRYPGIDAMVGLFAYNPPMMIQAVREAGRTVAQVEAEAADNKQAIQLIGFDEHEATLQGIKDGAVHGTVVQNPYKYGYESVRILAGLARGQSLSELGVPEDGFVNIPARKITSDNVEAFWADLKKKKAENKAG
jgi:ribose transport system substrate-binding protein